MDKHKNNEAMGTVKCYCLEERRTGRLGCPLTTNPYDLEHTFNFAVRGDRIVKVEIDDKFVCKAERKPSCKNCPFK